ncbi:gfo/Idh/MocA family oxidoreductase [Candidatus Bathyarchaeota archaeon]|nr:MAG: gfo/Idh/MocA family oxidoreductase [Candidatus Bathyarchaeota archaeon]
MTGRVKIAVVGCGSVSQRGILPHLSQPDIRDKVELTAVVDIVEERAKACKKRFGAREYYTDYDEMLRKADVDAVVIATPIPLHFEQAIKAIEAGKHVHLNKTMTTTLQEANKLIEARDRAGVKVVASPGTIFYPSTRRIRELLSQGYVGKPYWLCYGATWVGHEYEEFRQADDVVRGVDPTWYYKAGGGPMYDIAVYNLHTVTAIMGPAKRVVGFSGVGLKERVFKVAGEVKHVSVEMDDNTLLLLDWGDSVFGFVFGAFSIGAGGPSFFLSGSEGSISMRWHRSGRVVEVFSRRLKEWRKTELLPLKLPYVSGVHENIEEKHVYADIMHLVDCILNDREPVVNAEHARHVVEIIEKGYISAKTGEAQALETTFDPESQFSRLKEILASG